MCNIKMIVTDLDGTLLHADKSVSEHTIQVLNKGDEMVAECGFDLQTSNRLIQMIQDANETAEIVTAIGKKVLWNSLHISESDRLYKAEYYDYECPLSEAAHKIAAELPDKEAADYITQTCACKQISYRGENLYAFIPAEAGKLTMIQRLADILSLSPDEVAAFGDDENDIDMLKACGVGVAVSNALPEVRAVADEIILSNDEDGVAWFIENKILRR